MQLGSRREFFKTAALIAGGIAVAGNPFRASASPIKKTESPTCMLYRSVNGTPDENIRQVVKLAGGIERIIGAGDVVVIKPNVQWWNHGAPNLLSLKTFVDMIMNRPGGFSGEVVIAENCHRGRNPSTSQNAGWAVRFERNSDITGVHTMNDLTALLKKEYGNIYTTTHWINVANGGKRVFGPADGDGYVFCDGNGGVPLLRCDNGQMGNDYRETIMTYPIFTTDKGTVVDFKNGIWEKGAYTDRQLRFVNFSALNHHSTYCAVTSSIKNYLGISDLSGGPDPKNNGKLTGNYYNFHSFPFNEWAPGPTPGMLGKEIGCFLQTIRKADLNITTAEWIGLSSRIDLPVAHTRTVLACADPVALDYHSAKYLMHPNSKIPIHNPENKSGPLYQYLAECAKEYGGVIREESVSVKSYDVKNKIMHNDTQLAVNGEFYWGRRVEPIAKYLYMRYLNGKS